MYKTMANEVTHWGRVSSCKLEFEVKKIYKNKFSKLTLTASEK